MSIRTRTSGITFEVAPPPTVATPLDELIAGLQTDGIWTKLDRLWIFAQATEALALVDLVADSLATAVNSPTFTTDRGYTGEDLTNPTKYIDSNYSPTIDAVNYAQDSAHISSWSVTNTASVNGGTLLGSDDNITYTGILDTYLDGNVYARMNETPSGSQGAPGTRAGHWLLNRSGASATQLYQNGSLFSSPNGTSNGVLNRTFYILAEHGNSGAVLGTPNQIAMTSIGGNLTSTEEANFYSRLRTYMTAVGVP